MNINYSVFYSYVDVHSFGSNTIPFTEHIIKAGWLSLIEKGWCLVMISFAWLIIMDNFHLFVVIFCVSFWSIDFFKVVDFSWQWPKFRMKTPSTDTYDNSKHWPPNATKENMHQRQEGKPWKLPLLVLIIMISLTVTNIEL